MVVLWLVFVLTLAVLLLLMLVILIANIPPTSGEGAQLRQGLVAWKTTVAAQLARLEE